MGMGVNMKLKPVKKYSKPAYPIEKDFNPTNTNHYPFLSKVAITTALSLIFLTSCKTNNSLKSITKIENLDAREDSVKNKQKNDHPQILKAPVFVHGEGRGSVGCMAVSSPVFVSETDARDIILESFSKQGISFKESKKVFEGLDNQNFKDNYINHNFVSDSEIQKDTLSIVPITINYYSPEKNLGILYISNRDFNKYVKNPKTSSVSSYDLYGLANLISKEINSYNKFTCAVFYDPVIYNNNAIVNKKLKKIKVKIYGYYQKNKLSKKEKAELNELQNNYSLNSEAITTVMSIDSLKAQVNDFIDWYNKEKRNSREHK